MRKERFLIFKIKEETVSPAQQIENLAKLRELYKDRSPDQKTERIARKREARDQSSKGKGKEKMTPLARKWMSTIVKRRILQRKGS
jgi:hypothetical protein